MREFMIITYLIFFLLHIIYHSEVTAHISPLGFELVKRIADWSTPVAAFVFREDTAWLGTYIRKTSVPTTLWNCFERFGCIDDFTSYITQRHAIFPRPAFVILSFRAPRSSPISKANMTMFEKKYPNVHWIFPVYRHEEVLEYFSGHLCQVITVSEAEINVPSDGYLSCTVRKLYAAAGDISVEGPVPASGTYPKNEKITFSMHDNEAGYCFKSGGPLINVLKEAYMTLNNTLIERCNKGDTTSLLLDKRASLVLGFSPATAPGTYFAYATFPPSSMCFLTRRGEPLRPSFASTWTSFFAICFIMVTMATSFLLVLRIAARQHREGPNLLDWVTFFTATFMCRSAPEPTKSMLSVVRVAIAAWMFTVFFLAQFIQSNITASKTVPAYSSEIKHTTELISRLDGGTIQPCMHYAFAETIWNVSKELSHMKSIHEANQRCDSGCLHHDVFAGCISKAQSGTHALIHYCRAFLNEVNLPKGLGVGEDELMLVLQWLPTHRRYPLRYQHRRLMLALEESGLMDASLKRKAPPEGYRSSVPFNMPFSDYLYVYVSGCCLSLVAFFAELLVARKAERQ